MAYDKLVDSFVKYSLDELKSIPAKVLEKADDILEKSLRAYLAKFKKSHEECKTLLSWWRPIRFYDFYFKLSVETFDKSNDRCKKKIEDIRDLHSFGNKIIIQGNAGSGKSTFLKHLFFNCLETNFKVPVAVNLRELNLKRSNIEELIFSEFRVSGSTVSDNKIESLLKSGSMVVFLDGFDEIKADIKQVVIKSIKNLCFKYELNNYFISTRPGTEVDYIENFHVLKLSELQGGEITEFVSFQTKDFEPEEREQLIKSLYDPEYKRAVYEFLVNPLLLTLYILTFSKDSSVPTKKFQFYSRVVQTLFTEHDTKTKGFYIRDRKSKLSQDDIEDILKEFSFLSYFDEKFSFNYDYLKRNFTDIAKENQLTFSVSDLLNDLTTGTSLWMNDDGQYSFVHRSLQEYFTSVYISSEDEEARGNIYDGILEIIKNEMARDINNLLTLLREQDRKFYIKNFELKVIQFLTSHFEDLYNKDGVYGIISFLFIFFDYQERTDKKVACRIAYRNNSQIFNLIELDLMKDPINTLNKDEFIENYIESGGETSDAKIYIKPRNNGDDGVLKRITIADNPLLKKAMNNSKALDDAYQESIRSLYLKKSELENEVVKKKTVVNRLISKAFNK